MDDARHYLSEHCVQEKIRHAVADVLKSRPEAPAAIIGASLMSKPGVGKVVPDIYMWPPKSDHAEDLVAGSPVSLPCRVIYWVIYNFGLPVDIVGIDFAKDLRSPELMKYNPIHSVPVLISYENADGIGINGSESILTYICTKYRSLIPDSFYPVSVLKMAKVTEIFSFIYTTGYRATMYQYVYPCFGLMTECQYDLCKRDFFLDELEKFASLHSGPFFFGIEPTFADFAWASLVTGNGWVDEPEFEIPWKLKNVLPKYPNAQAVYDGVMALPEIAEFHTIDIGEGCPSAFTWNKYVTKQIMSPSLPGTGRKFKQFTTDGESMVHPNDIPYMPAGTKELYDMPLT